MNRRTLSIGAAVLVLAAGCNRNDSQAGNGSILGNDTGDRQAQMTVIGCLQPGEQGLGSREPNAASRSAEGVDQFVLTNAMPAQTTSPSDSSSSSSSTSSQSQPSASASGTTRQTYILEGKEDELRTHVGQQVEITGKPADDDDSSSSSSSTQANAQRLEVESVRMIAQNCNTR